MWAIAFSFLFLTAFIFIVSFAAISVSNNRAATSADVIAMSGCERAHRIASFNYSEVVTCVDDGVTIVVETRSKINLPLRVPPLFVHARAHAVHEL